MNVDLNRMPFAAKIRPAAVLTALLVLHTSIFAAPGAHGPNGEHLDAPAPVGPASALPRVEAASEAFELVAELRAGELAILVDRFETNEPVLGATLEVDSGALKAVATFRAEQGDYVVTDAPMLRALAATGEHGLVFTLVAGKDNDLLDGTLVTMSAAYDVAKDDHVHAHGNDSHGHGHEHHDLERAAWIAAGVAVVGLIGAVAWRRRGRQASGKQPQGEL